MGLAPAFWILPLLAGSAWSTNLTFLCLSFLICKMRKIIVSTSWNCWHNYIELLCVRCLEQDLHVLEMTTMMKLRKTVTDLNMSRTSWPWGASLVEWSVWHWMTRTNLIMSSLLRVMITNLHRDDAFFEFEQYCSVKLSFLLSMSLNDSTTWLQWTPMVKVTLGLSSPCCLKENNWYNQMKESSDQWITYLCQMLIIGRMEIPRAVGLTL